MTKKKTALIIEDSTVQAASVGELLRSNGLQVLHAPDGEEGLMMAQRFLPDVIVLDLKLPGLDGLSVCKYLAASPRTAALPVIILTQYADQADTVNAEIGHQAVEFIPKDSFADKVLVATLRELGILPKVDDT
jgi:CheY-like chemotaxis protein